MPVSDDLVKANNRPGSASPSKQPLTNTIILRVFRKTGRLHPG